MTLRTPFIGPDVTPPAHVHLMGVCGVGMAALAGLFHARGFRVTGSDNGAYPPMSDFLQRLGISVISGYSPANLQPRPDLVVVGNAIKPSNPEAQALEQTSIPYTSMSDALLTFFATDRRRIVVTGTHGKTTVSSMIAWILRFSDLDPGFMIGGIVRNLGTNHCLGGGHFVIEGDEYDTAYFDKSPKFLHYSAHIGAITACEFDHADIYRDVDEIQEQFKKFAASIPKDGRLVLCADDERLREIAKASSAQVVTYGSASDADWTMDYRSGMSNAMDLTVRQAGVVVGSAAIPIIGRHNALNALCAVAVAHEVGVDPQRSLDALVQFQGVHRRQEILAEIRGVLIVDDFAHHPTEVRETVKAVKARYPYRRLLAIFEPRTNTSRTSVFQQDYIAAFQDADCVLLREPKRLNGIPIDKRFSSRQLAADLQATVSSARAFDNTDSMLDFLRENVQSGDVALIMSNGDFDDLGKRLTSKLGED